MGWIVDAEFVEMAGNSMPSQQQASRFVNSTWNWNTWPEEKLKHELPGDISQHFFGQFIFILIIFSMCLRWSTPPHTHTLGACAMEIGDHLPFSQNGPWTRETTASSQGVESFQWHWFIFMLLLLHSYYTTIFVLGICVQMSKCQSFIPFVRPSALLCPSARSNLPTKPTFLGVYWFSIYNVCKGYETLSTQIGSLLR